MSKLKKKLSVDEARAAFHKLPNMQILDQPDKILTATTLKDRQIARAKNINEMRKSGELVIRPRKLTAGLRIWTRKYLDGTASVRDFERWRKAKPNEALPWAWKVTYGDGQQGSTVTVNRVNTLIQILTGQQLSPQGCQDNQLPQAVVSQTIDTQAVVVIDNPENP